MLLAAACRTFFSLPRASAFDTYISAGDASARLPRRSSRAERVRQHASTYVTRGAGGHGGSVLLLRPGRRRGLPDEPRPDPPAAIVGSVVAGHRVRGVPAAARAGVVAGDPDGGQQQRLRRRQRRERAPEDVWLPGTHCPSRRRGGRNSCAPPAGGARPERGGCRRAAVVAAAGPAQLAVPAHHARAGAAGAPQPGLRRPPRAPAPGRRLVQSSSHTTCQLTSTN